MTEAQSLVLKWKAALAQMGWPEDMTRKIVSELCEAGYRQCIDDIKAKTEEKQRIFDNALRGLPTMDVVN